MKTLSCALVYPPRSRGWPIRTVVLLALVVLLHGACSDNGGAPPGPPPDTSAGDIAGDAGDTGLPPPDPDRPQPPICAPPGEPLHSSCSGCHGAPPNVGHHPQNPRCYRCHGNVIDANNDFVDPYLHMNGVVNASVGCSSCHGWIHGTSPPEGLARECDSSQQAVGAHWMMRKAPIPAHRVSCTNCHIVPTSVDQLGHINGEATVTFQALATADGANPTWDGTTCSNTYCHGATLTGGFYKNPRWTDTSGRAGQCGACHRLTDPEGNEDANCHACHPTSVGPDQQILPLGTHLNGYIDMVEE